MMSHFTSYFNSKLGSAIVVQVKGTLDYEYECIKRESFLCVKIYSLTYVQDSYHHDTVFVKTYYKCTYKYFIKVHVLTQQNRQKGIQPEGLN